MGLFMRDPTLKGNSGTSINARYWALIPCAGSGSRAALSGPKQYQMVAGQPLVRHTLAAFAGVRRISKLVVVVAPGDRFFEPVPSAFWVADCGGATRAASVLAGLEFLSRQGAAAQDWVLVHDAARCLVTVSQIDALLDACEQDAVGGLLALKLADTLKCELDGRVAQTLDRSDKWVAQTPQMFRIGTLMQAMTQGGDHVTDEASAVEALGLRPLLVAGSASNFKVTYAPDFELADAVLRARERQHD